MKDDDFIYAVHELRREIPAGRLHSRALDLLVEIDLIRVVQVLSCASGNVALNSSTEGSIRNELSTVVCRERLANERSELS